MDAEEMTASPPRRGPKGRVLGLLLIGLGIMWFVAVTHVLSVLREEVLSGLLILLGAGLMLSARRGEGGRRSRASRWPIVAGVLLVFALIGHARSGAAVGADVVRAGRVPAAPIPPQPPQAPVMPSNVADVQSEYDGTVGILPLDLRAISPGDLDHQSIVIRMVAGEVTVNLPRGTHVEVNSHVAAGGVSVCGDQNASGNNIDVPYNNDPGTGPHLRLDIQLGQGYIDVAGCQPAPPSTTS